MRARWLTWLGLLLLGVVVLIPTWIIVSPDDEGLFLEVASTAYQAKHLFLGWFWDPFVAFGTPQPFSQTLSFHPILLSFRYASAGFSIGLLYQLQLWIGILSTWALCRHLRIRPWIAWLCVVTFALCTATLNYINDFWSVIELEWTFSPLLVLLLMRLLESERASSGAFYGVAAGLCAALMLLDGHSGVFPVYVLAIAALLVGRPTLVRRAWPWLTLALLVFFLATATRFYDIGLEYFRAPPGQRQQQIYPMSWISLLFYPASSQPGYRILAIGGPFFALALLGLVWREVKGPYVLSLRIGAAACFLAWFFVTTLVSPLSGNFYFRDPFTLFAVLLAALTLQRLWERFGRFRGVLVGAAVVQVAVLVWGAYPLYHHTIHESVRVLQGKPSGTLRQALKNQPLYAYLGRRSNRLTTRIYMAPGASDRLSRSLNDYNGNRLGVVDYEAAAFGLHGLRLVNGHFRGVDMHELFNVKETLLSEIFDEPSLADTRAEPEVLDIGYVLATPHDRVAKSLRLLRKFRLRDGTTIELYRTPGVWPDAVVLSPAAKQVESLQARSGCADPGLLCGDFSRVVQLRRSHDVAGETWHGTNLDVRLHPSTRPGVLMFSQLYRPGWQAKLSNGKTVDGYRLFGGLTGFDVPPGATSADIVFRPTARMVVAAISWATILLSAAFLLAVPLVRRRRRRQGTRLR